MTPDRPITLTDSDSLNSHLISPPSPHPRSRTPSFDGPRLSFSQLSRGELPVVVIPTGEQSDRRRLLLGAYAVLFTRYNIATFLSAFFGSDAAAWGMSGTWDGLIFAGCARAPAAPACPPARLPTHPAAAAARADPFGMALTSLFAPQVCLR